MTAAGAGLGGQARDLLVVGHPDRRALDDQAFVQAVGLGGEALHGAGRVGVAGTAVHAAVVVLHVQPPQAAVVRVLLDDRQVRAPDRAVDDAAAGHVRRLRGHREAELGGHAGQNAVDDADQVGLGGGELVDVAAAGQAGLDVDAVEVVLLQDRDDRVDETVRDRGRVEVDAGRRAADGEQERLPGRLGRAHLGGRRHLHARVHAVLPQGRPVLAPTGRWCDLEAVPPEDRNCMILCFTNQEWRSSIPPLQETQRLMAARFRATMAGHLAEPAWKMLLKRLCAPSRRTSARPGAVRGRRAARQAQGVPQPARRPDRR
ncbi:hypothetical protein STENM36S_04392 [Streptomyces tendae]